MINRRKIASLTFAGVAGTGMAAFAAGPALAVGGIWTVTPTGQWTAGGKITLGDPLACSATVRGSVPKSTGASSKSPVATITSATFKSCTGFGATLNAHLKKTAYLWVSQPTTVSGVTKGFIAGPTGRAANAISASLSGSTLGAGCHARIVGSSLPDSYHNSGKLVIDPGHVKTLTIKSPTSCIGVAANSKVYLSGSLTVTPRLTVNNT